MTRALLACASPFLLAYSYILIGRAIRRNDYVADIIIVFAFGIFCAGGLGLACGLGVFLP
jgi:hypothetical protein